LWIQISSNSLVFFNLKRDYEFDQQAGIESKSLHCVPIPEKYIGSTWGDLFVGIYLDHDVLAIGLYRDISNEMGNRLPFVYTNPLASLILLKTDKIYAFLSSTTDLS
jgi:hypothetical protein